MIVINDPEAVARYYEMDRLVRKKYREMSLAERDRRMQFNRALAITPQRRLWVMDMLVRSAADLNKLQRCDHA